MSRNISPATQALLDDPVGLEPIFIVAISWGSYVDAAGVVHTQGAINKYADKDILDPITGDVIIKGVIKSVSDLDEIVKLDAGSSTASLNITISDTDGKIKQLYNKFDLHKRPVIVYQYFSGLDPTIYPFDAANVNTQTDAFEIFRGEISSPVQWSEGQREFTFDVLSKVYSLEAGFAPEEGQFAYTPIDLIGKPWPMCFGTPIHVPAVKFRHVASGTVLSSFGLPDYTLSYKLRLLTFIQKNLISSYNYYRALMDTAQDIEIPAYQLQEEYAHHIVSFDALKQSIESLHDDITELNRQITTLRAQYDDDTETKTRADILAQMQPLIDERNRLDKISNSYLFQKVNMTAQEKSYKLRLKNVKFETTVVNRLRKKCRALLGDYFNITKQIDEVNTASLYQRSINTTSSAVMVGPDFPQQTVRNYAVNGSSISAIMNGYSLQNVVPLAAYKDLVIGPRQDDDVTSFWLSDQNSVDLTGMYLWLSGSGINPNTSPPITSTCDGRIVKVTGQVGNKVTVQLVRSQRNPRIHQEKVDYINDPKIKDAFNTTLSRLLTGNESEEQINAIANEIPKTINPKIWNILQGGNNVTYIELQNRSDPTGVTPPKVDLTDTYFTLTYDNIELTDPIYFTDTAKEIQTVILASTQSIDNNDIKVTIDKYWPAQSGGKQFARIIKIQYSGLMRPLTLNSTHVADIDSGSNLNSGGITLRRTTTEPQGCVISFNRDCLRGGKNVTVVNDLISLESPKFALFYRGIRIPIIMGDDPVIIRDKLVAADSTFATDFDIYSVDKNGNRIGPSSLYFNDIVIDYNVTFTPMFLDIGDVKYIIFDNDLNKYREIKRSDLKDPFDYPNISVNTFGGGAHEYTYNQRYRKLQNLTNKNVNSPNLTKYRNKVRALLKTLKDPTVDAAAKQGAKEALQEAMTAYRAMIKTVEQSGYNNDEAYKLISDKEFTLLYDMEVTGYTEWLNQFDDVDVEQNFSDDIDYEFTVAHCTGIREACKTILPNWLNHLYIDDDLTDQQRVINGQYTLSQQMYEIYLLPNDTQPWIVNIGDSITLEGNFQEDYVCSIIPGRIKAVYANKQVAGINRLIPVPSRYYVKSDVDTSPFGADANQYLNCIQQHNNLGYRNFGYYHGVTITLVQPLQTIDSSWSDELYVTVESVVGPNICDVLCWLIYTYTDLSIDLPSFQHVWAMQQRYPVNFALIEKTNVLALCEDLAWQARCTLWIKQDRVYIRYLPEEPTPVKTITKDDIQQASLVLDYTPTESLVTKYVVNWRSNYAQSKDFTMTLRRNLTRYNEISDSRDMKIYNIRDLVWKSATWWVIRNGTTFRTVKFKLFMNNINLETQDCVTIDTGDDMISVGPIKAIITKASYNSSDFSIDVEAWLPIAAGYQTIHPFAWPKDLNIQDYYPLVSDIAGGDAGNPINTKVPNNINYNFNNRPVDVGRANVGDNFDSEPDDPSSPFSEVDYKEVQVAPTTINANMSADLDNNGIQHAEVDSSNGNTIGRDETVADNNDKDEGEIFYGSIWQQLTKETVYDSVGNAKQFAYNRGNLYNIILDKSHTQSEDKGSAKQSSIIAYGVDIDTRKVLPQGIRVNCKVVNSKWTFTVQSMNMPSGNTGPDGQPLDFLGGGFF